MTARQSTASRADFARHIEGAGMIKHLLANPHYLSGAILAKVLTALGTLVWSALVIWKSDALSSPAYNMMLSLAPEDLYGWLLGTLSLCLLWRLWCWSPPTFAGLASYFVIMCFWSYVFMTLLFFNEQRVYPTGLAGAFVIFILAVCAFGANPIKPAIVAEGSPDADSAI